MPSTDAYNGFGTRAIHAGQRPDPSTGAIMTPIYQTSTYVQATPGDHQGHEYARVTNPTRSALEGNLAALEGARTAVCFASGVAGIDAILKGLRPGDHVVASDDLYGGTIRLFRHVFEPYGIRFSFVDMRDAKNVDSAMTSATRLIWIETPTNPLLRIVDIAAVTEIGHRGNATVAVDNTFATPYLQQPLSLGADLILHSSTKYLGGHSDVIGGAVCLNDESWEEKLRFQIKSSGAVPGPMDCFLVLRGTKTLHVRMDRHCSNARRLADFLLNHPGVDHVLYPGLESHNGHALAARQMSDFGAMITFTLKDKSGEPLQRVLSQTKVFALAESLGGVESLIEHPASMTHASVPADERARIGLTDDMIRLSVGIEEADDLVADLDSVLPRR